MNYKRYTSHTTGHFTQKQIMDFFGWTKKEFEAKRKAANARISTAKKIMGWKEAPEVNEYIFRTERYYGRQGQKEGVPFQYAKIYSMPQKVSTRAIDREIDAVRNSISRMMAIYQFLQMYGNAKNKTYIHIDYFAIGEIAPGMFIPNNDNGQSAVTDLNQIVDEYNKELDQLQTRVGVDKKLDINLEHLYLFRKYVTLLLNDIHYAQAYGGIVGSP